MTQSIREVMTYQPVTVPATASITDAARVMRDEGIGDVIVMRDRVVAGILTDRDIAVRAVADDLDPQHMEVETICSSDLITLRPTDEIEDALSTMRHRALRRLPVVADDGRPVGIVSLGDLAVARDPESALAYISAEPANT